MRSAHGLLGHVLYDVPEDNDEAARYLDDLGRDRQYRCGRVLFWREGSRFVYRIQPKRRRKKKA